MNNVGSAGVYEESLEGHNDPTSGDIFTHFVNEEGGHPHHNHGISGLGEIGGMSHENIEFSHSASMSGHMSRGTSTGSHSMSRDFELSPTALDGGALMTPTGGHSSNKLKTPRSRSSRSRKGRPTRMMLPMGAPTGTAYVNVGRAFPGLTMVYRCPFAHCHRFYATKLALRRHFVSYNHMITTEYIDFDTSNTVLTGEEVKRKAIQSMPRLFKCPVLECSETFQDVFGLCGHFSETHAPISEPTISKRQRSPTPYHELMEWTEMYDDCLEMTFQFHVDLAQSVPDMFTARDDKHVWRFLSIFDIVGPRPSFKRAQFIHHLREVFLRNYNPSLNNTLLVNEDILKLMITLAFCEMMPQAYMLTRDYSPSSGAHLDQDGILDPWNDEDFLWGISTESVDSMLKFGAVHSSRNFVKKAKIRKSMTPDDDPEQLLEKEDLTNDRFVCQVPGCGKVFASVPAYKYHMNHFEHDLEALLGSSSLLRQVLFPLAEELSTNSTGSGVPVNMNNGVNWYTYERVNLRFVSGALKQEEDANSSNPISTPLINLVYSVNDAVHILHGYIDQQLPMAFSWQLMKKREMTAINPLTNEFTLTFKKGDVVSMMKAAPGSTHIPLTTAPQKRKKKPFLFPPSTLSNKKSSHPTAAGGSSYNQMLMQMNGGHGEEGQSLGIDPWTLGKPIPTFPTDIGGLEMKFLSEEEGHIMAYQQSKLILPIHPTAVTLEEPMGTWLDYSSVQREEEEEIDSGNMSATVIIHNSSSGVQTEVLQVLKGLVLEGGRAAISVAPAASTAENYDATGTSPVAMSALDWFPHMAPSSGGKYLLSLVTAGGGSVLAQDTDEQTGRFNVVASVKLWNVVVSKDAKDGGYKIDQLVFNSSLVGEEGLGGVISLKWYPFTLQADTNESDVKGMLGVLYASGDLLVYVLPRHLLFPSNIQSPHYRGGQRVIWREICRISIPHYSVTTFCWNKQQTILPSSSDLNAPASTVMTTQIILGTKEGSIGICDLSLPTNPQMLMLIPAHQSIITSIDWSPLNPLSVVTASTDGTVHLWNLADMYHSITLATSKGPFIGAQWLYTLSKPYDSRTATHDYAFPRTNSNGGGSIGEDFDPARHVLMTDDLHYAKVVHVDEPGKSIIFPTPNPRPLTSVYPNARLQSPLIVSVDYEGTIHLVAWRHDRDLKNGNFKVSIGKWNYRPQDKTFSYVQTKVIEEGTAQDNIETSYGAEANVGESIGFTAVAWHLLPIGIFATVSSTGLLYIHSL